MKIAVIGAGPIGMLTALLGATRGHDVAIWSPRGRIRAGHVEAGRLRLQSSGALTTSASFRVLGDLSSLPEYDIVVFAVPATAYEPVIPLVLSHLTEIHIVVCSGALSLVPLWIAERALRDGTRLTVACWGTTLGTARITEEGTLKIGTVRGPFEMAVIPKQQEQAVLDALEGAFGAQLRLAPSMLTPLLSNVNPVAHAGQSIPNLSRMERGEAWSLFGHFMDVGARIAEEIDAERLAIAKGFGVSVRSLREHYHKSYHVPNTALPQISRAIVDNGSSPLGPTSLAHRYLEEDVPFGLVVYEVLAKVTDVSTPATSAAITLLGLAQEKSYRESNAILSELDLPSMTPTTLAARVAGEGRPELV